MTEPLTLSIIGSLKNSFGQLCQKKLLANDKLQKNMVYIELKDSKNDSISNQPIRNAIIFNVFQSYINCFSCSLSFPNNFFGQELAKIILKKTVFLKTSNT